MPEFPHHFETMVDVPAAPPELFENVDDHERLAEHMTGSSMMMGGSKMSFSYDAGGGKAVGSRIRMTGSILGLSIELEEVIVERVPPFRKTWETIGEPRLLVIGGYRMGFEIAPQAEESRLKVFIDWREPPPPWRWLGRLFGRAYAKWCAESMASGTATLFTSGRASHVQAAA